MEPLIPAKITPMESHAARHEMLDALKDAFLGLRTSYPLADDTTAERTYLDSAASNLRLKVAHDIVEDALTHYANTHSQLHYGARIMTETYERAHEIMLDFVGASEDYTAIFCGSGVTSGLNRAARVLTAQRPERDVVITTLMEHHANDLPHRKHAGEVVHVPLETDPDGEAGRVDTAALRTAIREHGDRLNYVAVTGASNVTGITNPIHEIARLAHDVGALIVVDAAQSAAHTPLHVSGASDGEQLDVVCLSGHKIYAPGSPGVLITRKELFAGHEPEVVGGGIVERVEKDRYMITDTLPKREEAGTPNIPGALLLAATLYCMGRVGMDVIEEDERRLTQYALERFDDVPGLHLYGSHRLEVADRIGVLSFNLEHLPHGLVAAALNDYFGIAMRNQCFCAQPFVRRLLGRAGAGGAGDSCLDGTDLDATPDRSDRQPGMVRASLGLYNTEADIDRAVDALTDIATRPQFYREHYRPVNDGSGDWVHRSFSFDVEAAFNIEAAVDARLETMRAS